MSLLNNLQAYPELQENFEPEVLLRTDFEEKSAKGKTTSTGKIITKSKNVDE